MPRSGGLKEISRNLDNGSKTSENQKKGLSQAKNCSKVPNRVTTLNPYKSGLEWSFEALPVPQIISWESSSCRKRTWVNCTSAGRAMAVQRG